MEAIKGFEYITFEQKNADEEPTHATMLPFTRNLFDPMDFTPVCLEKTGKTKLRTTPAFELALSVIFTSGVQHYVDIPEGTAKMSAYVKTFMQHVPSIWDDTKFIDGYPGKFAVFTRRGDGHWYVAGINGEATEKTLTLDLAALTGVKGTGLMITDGQGELFAQQPVALGMDKKLNVTAKPHGGFSIVFD
jgi:alpha-glucosidase